jgi:hypothetical protein
MLFRLGNTKANHDALNGPKSGTAMFPPGTLNQIRSGSTI